jgi:hypothetical protein
MACLTLTLHAETTIRTDPHHTTTQMPPWVLTRVEHALAALRAWNAAIEQARRMEALAHQPGRYEHNIRYGMDAGLAHQRTRSVEAWRWLGQFEALAVANGVDPQAVHDTLGGRPELLAEGPDVQDWRPSARTQA